ncbi:hypothetical protein PYCCODRAFT_1449571 [Trametes coccinea BRFM310]|uniref:RNA polymerase II elongation factor ELL N-terminal domain-containing protein n=1 Tax=Trametes coccinea (strain BRFM310) TaxID=1353009 RepID=A0A1Y2J1F1_TRAC3|nr:hypothetical protein PYCCODRAFT_1449571 [Trametes coccinea BRFM310]
MPLPSDATLTLQGQSRPGDPLHVKPKQAMLFRMSAETFEQLEGSQNPPRLEFEFGNTPGLYINDTFYPVTVNQENGPHELYLRMASAQKPMAPLKLYANVIGKFMVERQLGEKVEGSVRDRTLEAEKLRTERKTVYLDTPPDLGHPTSKSKSKKDAAAARRPAAASGSHSLSSTRASRVASPLPGAGSHARGSSSDISSTRARLIHCLALKPRTTEVVIQLCAGKNPAPQLEEELLSLLPKVAEPRVVARNNDPQAAQCWQLKLESWLEVRPYEWPTLSADERTLMSRQARTAYSRLKIPESDPVWEYARYRDAGAGSGPSAKPVAGPSASAAEPKKGMMSKSTTKKAKAADGGRKKVQDIIIAKDESARPGRDASGGKGKARERDVDESSAAGTPTSATRPPIRRLPGSGYQVKASATPPASEARAHSPLPPPPKRSGPVDARESRRELPAPSGSAKPLPPIAPPAAPSEHKAPAQFQKKSKEAQAQRAAEERREERQRERDRKTAAEERQRAKGQGSPIPAASLSFKRKKLAQDGNDSEYSEREVPLSTSTSKKRRLDEHQQQHAAASEKPRIRDPSLPKKPVVAHEPSPASAPRPKVKKEPSPLSIAFSPPPSSTARSPLPPRPSLPEKPQPPSSSSSSTKDDPDPPHRASSSKRRRSPIYTSSEDESDPRPRARGAATAASEEPAAKKLKAKHTTRFRPRGAMPADRAGLRSYYKQCFLVYIKLYNQQAQRRDRIERLLQETESGEIAAQDASDDEGDVAELDPDVLVAFMAEFRAVVEEMDRIRAAWERLGGRVSETGELMDG